MSTTAERPLRIGEVAELTGTTPRTIRYYEEIGLLPGAADRPQGQHRYYTAADVERVKEIVRLRDLLGLSLEQLSRLLEAEAARAELRPLSSRFSSSRWVTSRSSSSWSGSGGGSSRNWRRSSPSAAAWSGGG